MMIEFTTADMTEYLMEDYGLDVIKALDMVYTSRTYQLLKNVETALYLEESPYVYDLLKEEDGFEDLLKSHLA